MNGISNIKARALTVVVASALAAGGIGMLSQPASAKVKTPKTLKQIVKSVPNPGPATNLGVGLIEKNLSPTDLSLVNSLRGVANDTVCGTVPNGLLPTTGLENCEPAPK